MSKQYVHDVGISITCRKGNIREGGNQDNYFLYADQVSKLIVITDGHGTLLYTYKLNHMAVGPFGDMVSFFISMTMAKLLVEDYIYIIDPKVAIKHAFTKCQKELSSMNQRKVSHPLLYDHHHPSLE